MTLGDRIKKLREDNKMTQEELAAYINSTKQTIYKYENNIITNIPSDKVESIAKALNTSPAYLMGWENSGKGTPSEYFDDYVFDLQLKAVGCSFDGDPSEGYMWINYPDGTFEINLYELNDLKVSTKSYLKFRLNELKQNNIDRFNQKAKITPLPKREEALEHLQLNTAHRLLNATEENIQHDEDIMDDPYF